MGRGRAWDSKENLHVCQAYCQATNHYHATQRDNNCHKSDSFWNDVATRFHGLAPPDSTRGTYSDRSLSSVKCHLLHKVFPDCNKFSKVLRKVTAEENLPGNLSPKQLYNIAVAFHLDKTKKPDCDYKRFNSDENWPNSLAYRKILRFEPKWRSTDDTMQQPSGLRSNVSDDDFDAATESGTEEDAASGNHNSNDDNDSSDTSSDFNDHNCTGAAVPRRLTTSVRKSSKRVRGDEDEGGRDKTRNNAWYDALEKMVSLMHEQCRLMARKNRISELKLLMALAKKRGDDELVKKSKVELMKLLRTALQSTKFAPASRTASLVVQTMRPSNQTIPIGKGDECTKDSTHNIEDLGQVGRNPYRDPRTVVLRKSTQDRVWGFTLSWPAAGGHPVILQVKGPVALAAGLRVGDVVLAVNGQNTALSTRTALLEEMQNHTMSTLTLKVVEENCTNKKDFPLDVIDLSKGMDDNVNDKNTSMNPVPPLKITTLPKATPADPKKKAPPVSNKLLWSNVRAPGTMQPQPYMTYPFYTSAADFRAPGFMQSQPYITHPLYALAADSRAPGALQPQSYMTNPLYSLAAASALKGPTPDKEDV